MPNLEALLAGRDLINQQLEVISIAALFSIGGSHVLVYIVILVLVFPSFTPVKTYKPQSEWISATIGDEPRFGMADAVGVGRRGGFSYYTGTAVNLLDGPREAIDYLRKYPNTLVLVKSNQFDQDFQALEREARLRSLQEIRVGSHLYKAMAAGSEIKNQ